ncbi:ribonuclease T2 [Xylariaceae sp. FL1272]|nr:ribonuclease T2 [Xylariaceae sp. FL1272]
MIAPWRAFAFSLLSGRTLAGLYPFLSVDNHTCALNTPLLSCSDGAHPDLVDTCCVETYGGLILQTQFWNTYTGLETEGQLLPKDSWTIHGLWPDFCNGTAIPFTLVVLLERVPSLIQSAAGSYTQYCDLSRQYDPVPSPNTTNGLPDGTPVAPWTGEPISDFIEQFGRYDLLAYMKKYVVTCYSYAEILPSWPAPTSRLNQPSWYLWAHEYSKHATCYSTFDTECYGPQYVEHSEIVDFFETVVSYYQNLPTWRWLSAKGIRPSNTTSYSLSDIQGALTDGFGKLPWLGCTIPASVDILKLLVERDYEGPKYNETDAGKNSTDAGYTVFDEAWYYYHVHGKVQRVQPVPVHANITGGSVTSCAKAPNAIWYFERTPGSVA